MAMPTRLLSVAALLLAFGGCAGSIRSGSISARALVSGQPPPVDSIDALRAARAAQSRFEMLRFGHLPWTSYAPRPQRCDEIVGRFCLWFEDVPSTWTPPPEKPEVRRAREGLLAWLAAAERADPRDTWIVGQRVRYLIEADSIDEADAAARACGAERWWCLALSGYVLHAREDFAGAEATFEEAIRALPPAEAAKWTDIGVLLERKDRQRYERLEGGERESFERRFWHLANPVQSRPGNARRSEHFVRHVHARLLEDARAPDLDWWGEDSREILIRYGAAAGWERARSSSLELGASPTIVTRFPRGGRHFLPTFDEASSPARLEGELLARNPRAPRTEYAPSFADGFLALDRQVALFRRGDSALVAASWEIPRDSLADTTLVEVAFVLGSADGETSSTTTYTRRGGRGSAIGRSGSAPEIASLEVVAPSARRVARARAAVSPTAGAGGDIRISDVLVLEGTDDPPASLEAALPLARPSLRLPAGSQTGLFWEVYAADTVTRRALVTLTLRRGKVGLGRRIAERLGFRDRMTGLRLQWEERLAGAVLPRSIVLDLARIEPGAYTMELTVAPVGERAVTATRKIEIVR